MPGGIWSGGGLADWESRDILTLVVVILGIALIATAYTGENPNPWPGLAGMAVIVVAQYARLFRPSSEQSGRLVAAGMVVLLFGRPRTSTDVPLTVYCVQLVLLLASAQAVFLAGRRARQQRRR